MSDERKTEIAPVQDQSSEPLRRRWHAPQFVVAEFSLTGTASNPGVDGGVFPASTGS